MVRRVTSRLQSLTFGFDLSSRVQDFVNICEVRGETLNIPTVKALARLDESSVVLFRLSSLDYFLLPVLLFEFFERLMKHIFVNMTMSSPQANLYLI
jgi:hypothetical protein